MFNYAKEQLDAIKKVINVFDDYIKNSEMLDILWSEKIGYVLIDDINKERAAIDSHPVVVTDASWLCVYLLYKVAYDVLIGYGTLHEIEDSSPSEWELIRKACIPYVEQLPEYEELVRGLFC